MKRVEEIISLLEKTYPNARLILNYENEFQLLIAAILAAQCTDERVNKVTAILFKKYPHIKDFAEANVKELERDIKPTGFYRNKAKNIILAAKKILEEFQGKLPADMDKLMELPGVARKTANMIMGNAFNIESGIVVDTHMRRVAFRLDLTKNKDPEKIEKDLIKIIPKDKWIKFPHLIAFHGREVCQARKPKCDKCCIEKLCYSADKTI